MYLSGGAAHFRAKLPDDGQAVTYEIELVQVVGIRDLFGSSMPFLRSLKLMSTMFSLLHVA